AQHSRIINNVAVHLPDAMVGVEENDKKYHRETERYLGTFIDSEDQNKNGSEHEAGERVENLDIRIKNACPEVRTSQQQSKCHARRDTQHKRAERFVDCDEQMLVDSAAAQLVAGIRQPLPGTSQKRGRLREEEWVDDAVPGAKLP